MATASQAAIPPSQPRQLPPLVIARVADLGAIRGDLHRRRRPHTISRIVEEMTKWSTRPLERELQPLSRITW
jgi:hypothetical protein